MEFLRFGSSIPGAYWGCCAMDIIQNFNFDPDQKSSIQLVNGDGGYPTILTRDGKQVGAAFAGPTYRDIFHQRLRCGTFDKIDMPNHGFIAILTENQVKAKWGVKWLAILKEAGFEFIRTVSNSVYQGASLGTTPVGTGGSNNYVFALFRNIGSGNVCDQFRPPAEWTKLPSVAPEAWERTTDTAQLTVEQYDAHRVIWERIGPPKLMTEEEVVKAGAPVILAGLRSQYAQQTKEMRDSTKKVNGVADKPDVIIDPFGATDVGEGDDYGDVSEYDTYDDGGGYDCTDPECACNQSYPSVVTIKQTA